MTRPRLPELALATLSLLLVSAVAEMAVRSVPRKWVPELADPRAVFRLRDRCRPSSDPELYFELIPDNPAEEVNAAGYRGPLLPQRKPTGVRRLLGLGDSTLYGWGVKDADSYLRRAAALLARGDGGPVEAVNLAVPGYNSAQELALLRKRGLAFEPDLIVLGYDHNDALPQVGSQEQAVLVPDQVGRNPLGSELWRYLARRIALSRRTALHRGADGNTILDGLPVEGVLWDRHLEALAEIARLAHQRGIPVVVVVVEGFTWLDPEHRSAHYRVYHQRLNAFWRKNGFVVVECYDVFQDLLRSLGTDDYTRLWHSVDPPDGHPNTLAHQAIAEALVRTITAEKLLR